jgi:methylenetetrahydrofolate reductase (NADPH)
MRIDEILPSRGPCFSVEFFPPKTDEGRGQLLDSARQLADLEPAFVSVTYGAAGSTRDGTVEIADKLHNELGLETMAHLSCVGETAEGLRAVLDRIAEIGIDNVLALRGDPPRGETDFEQPPGGLGSAAELAGFISDDYRFAIGGACFPEVHPEAPDLDTDLAYLKTKVDRGATFLITQLFFDNQVYFDFVAAARAKGIDVPIIAGVIPIASYAQTERICSLCDASIPQPLADAMAALGGDEQAEFELGVAYAAQQCAELLIGGAPGIHFYALNKAPATRAVLSALRSARPWERSGREATPTQA